MQELKIIEDINNYERFIVDSIKAISGKYTPYQVFSDWVTMSAMAISNACNMIHDSTYEEREERYRTIASKYSIEELKMFGNMTGALSLVLEGKFADVLGEIYMKSGCGNSNTGQFFTPYHLSYLAAKLCYSNQFEHYTENGVIEINEPSVGAGGMMIAIAQIAKENGIDYQKKLHIVAQDLDYNGVYMTYIQLSLLGIKAIVVQGDTLRENYRRGYDERRVYRTPAEMGALL